MDDVTSSHKQGEAVLSTAPPVYLSRLYLSHFRNYEQLELPLSPEPVVLTGHNGAGKTNLLEAVSLLLPGRGLRRARLGELDAGAALGKASASTWGIHATIHTAEDDEVSVGTGRDPEAPEQSDRRVVKMEGEPCPQSALADVMAQVWLTPQHDQLFQEGNSARRRYFDRLVYGFESDHARHVNAYEQSMRERNHLLGERRSDDGWYNALEHKMAEHAAVIAAYRLATLERLNHAISLSTRSFPKAQMELHGTVEDWLAEGATAAEVEERFRELLASERGLDLATGRTQSGVHRTEWRVFHADKQTEAGLCSTGEQKAMLLSIVLAVAKARVLKGQGAPIMLLDEVVAHLDASKRAELFEEIIDLGVQAWLTGTDLSLFEPLGKKAQFFLVKNASVTCIEPGLGLS